MEDTRRRRQRVCFCNPPYPQTYVVIRLAPIIPHHDATLLIRKIIGKKEDGGLELLVHCDPNPDVSLYR